MDSRMAAQLSLSMIPSCSTQRSREIDLTSSDCAELTAASPFSLLGCTSMWHTEFRSRVVSGTAKTNGRFVARLVIGPTMTAGRRPAGS